MIKLFLIFIISINIYANNNQTIDDKFKVLEEQVLKVENENIKLTEKINHLESTKLVITKQMDEKLNSNNWITYFISILAVFISGYSLYLNYKKDKLKVKVIPVSLNKTKEVTHLSQNYYNNKSSKEYFGLEITNYSTFEIKVNYIAFFTNKDKANKYTLNKGFFNLEEKKINFPLTLNARDSITIYFLIEDIREIHPNKISIFLASGEKIDSIDTQARRDLINSL